MTTNNASGASQNVQHALKQREEKREQNRAHRIKEADELKEKGNALFKKGNYAEAIKLYKQALQRAVGSKEFIYSNLAAAYLKMCSYEEAVKVATKALSYNPMATKPRYRRALARENLGHLKGALIDLEMVLTIEPNCSETKAEWRKVVDLSRDRSKIKDSHMRVEDLEKPALDAIWEVDSDIESDSSDCQHRGNNTPCRFYNRDGCNRGASCRFSHAPDKKSVRDKLGRNVCLYHILNICKYGDRCSYSHSFEHLPEDGWWKNREQNRALKEFTRLAITTKKVITRTSARKAALLDADYTDEDSDDEDDLDSDTDRDESDVPSDDVVVHPHITSVFFDPAQLNSTNSPTAPHPTQQITDRFILLLTLEDLRIFNDVFDDLSSTLPSKVRVETAQTSAQAMNLLSSPGLAGVVVGDAGVARRKANAVLMKLVEYAKAGGKVVFGGCFSSFAKKDEMNTVFRKFDVSWKIGSYHRTTFVRNPQNLTVKDNRSLDEQLSMKAVHVASIIPADALYVPTEDSYLESLVFAPEPITNLNEAPSVGRKVGDGYLGFVGDVNGETGSTKIVLAMLGLLDTTSNPDPSTRDAAAVSSGASTGLASVVQSSSSTQKRKPFPFVMVISYIYKEIIEEWCGDMLSALKSKVEVLHGLSNDRVLDLLPSNGLTGLIVTTHDILDEENAELLSAIIEWTKRGGTLILLRFLDGMNGWGRVPGFFRKLGLNWEPGTISLTETVLEPNGKNTLTKSNPGLPRHYPVERTHHVRGIKPEQAVYVPKKGAHGYKPLAQITEAAVAYADVGKGHLGFVGHSNEDNEGTTAIVMAMLKLSSK
ncbi:hypothetical protein AX16_008965 [Volvariella volvacea WC 439]|nr:hypothetical protein AX16_008965 [Volvariella volvacea WC 439]